MRFLYGSPIPPGAVSVQIRPVFGRGNTQALYQGPLEENGAVIDETKVAARVAANGSFWDYIDATKRAGREVGTAEGGIYSWRLSLQYLDQSGAVAVVDGKTSFLTAEAFEFYRAAPSGDSKETIGIAMVQTFDRMVSAHTKLMADLTENIQKAVCASVSAAMGPLNQAVDRVAQMSREDTGRADEMTKVAMKLLKEQQPQPDVFDGFAKVLPAGALALKALKDLKN